MKEIAKTIVYGTADFLTHGKGIARNIGGQTIRFPARYSRYYPPGYEPGLFGFLGKNLSKGDTFFDCGAHFGLFSVVASRLVGNEGKVFCFEPMPNVRAICEDVVRLNECSNVEVRDEAVSSQTGTATFFDTGNEGSNANSLVKQDRHDGGLTVKTISVDDLRDERSLKIDCMKIDVEGAEFDLLRGAANSFTIDRPAVFLSLHPTAISKTGVSLNDIWEILETYKMQIELKGQLVEKGWFIEQKDLFDVECLPA